MTGRQPEEFISLSAMVISISTFFIKAIFLKTLIGDAAQPACHDDNRGVGAFALSQFRKQSPAIGRGFNRGPGGFDERVPQITVALRQQVAVMNLAARSIGRGNQPGANERRNFMPPKPNRSVNPGFSI